MGWVICVHYGPYIEGWATYAQQLMSDRASSGGARPMDEGGARPEQNGSIRGRLCRGLNLRGALSIDRRRTTQGAFDVRLNGYGEV
jgi:hypothetical protein